MLRYRLRTLLLLSILGPPVLAGAWFGWCAWSEYRYRQLHEFEWGGVIVLDDLQPIELDDLREPMRETVAP